MTCGFVRQQQLREQVAALKQQSDAAVQQCDTQYPKSIPSNAMARAQCMVSAVQILRPVAPFPDLWDLYIPTYLATAERVQRGQLTVLQANEVLAQKRAELASEEQRRMLASRSVTAQENIAAANMQAAGPRSCIGAGNTVTCF
jgi:hypothetical protein